MGKVALYYFRSSHKVHPLVAKVWSHRLKDHIVIAANEDFIPGKVDFNARTRTGIDLFDFFKRYGLEDQEVGYRLETVSGGTVEKFKFSEFLRRLGFKKDYTVAA